MKENIPYLALEQNVSVDTRKMFNLLINNLYQLPFKC